MLKIDRVTDSNFAALRQAHGRFGCGGGGGQPDVGRAQVRGLYAQCTAVQHVNRVPDAIE
jgi:hypothetical protein